MNADRAGTVIAVGVVRGDETRRIERLPEALLTRVCRIRLREVLGGDRRDALSLALAVLTESPELFERHTTEDVVGLRWQLEPKHEAKTLENLLHPGRSERANPRGDARAIDRSNLTDVHDARSRQIPLSFPQPHVVRAASQRPSPDVLTALSRIFWEAVRLRSGAGAKGVGLSSAETGAVGTDVTLVARVTTLSKVSRETSAMVTGGTRGLEKTARITSPSGLKSAPKALRRKRTSSVDDGRPFGYGVRPVANARPSPSSTRSSNAALEAGALQREDVRLSEHEPGAHGLLGARKSTGPGNLPHASRCAGRCSTTSPPLDRSVRARVSVR